MTPLFTSMVCTNNCDQREAKVAEAIYRTMMAAPVMAGLGQEPWEEVEEEDRELFFKLAKAALAASAP